MTVTLFHGDCLEVMPTLEAQSFDAIIADLPYGTTACEWDIVIPFEPLWREYKRLIKPRGVIVLFGSQPFTSLLVMSNLEWFKYCWVWDKHNPAGHLNAKIMPLPVHEDICVFGDGRIVYNPQMRLGKWRKRESPKKHSDCYGAQRHVESYGDQYYPTTLIDFSNANQRDKKHSTQKPLALLEYLVRTYTNKGDAVLDNVMGSGTTGVACQQIGRNFVGIEKNAGYFEIAKQRIETERDQLRFDISEE